MGGEAVGLYPAAILPDTGQQFATAPAHQGSDQGSGGGN